MKPIYLDMLGLLGLGLFTGGCAWIYYPLGLIVPGLALLAAALWGASRWRS